ncbi:hypothetical protein CG709_20360 [Lachnotalea glycerini]|nr:hypothetical protein CG709_20360 [Lachnotalea glycerini]
MIKQCIVEHRGSVLSQHSSIESECLASADAMSHIDQLTSLLHLAYVKRNMGVVEGADWTWKKIERSWAKLCPEAQIIIKNKYLLAKDLLDHN